MKPQLLLIPKTRFPCVLYHAHFMPNVPWSFILTVWVYFCRSPWIQTLDRLGIFVCNLDPANQTFLETFWHTQVQNQKYLWFDEIQCRSGALWWPMTDLWHFWNLPWNLEQTYKSTTIVQQLRRQHLCRKKKLVKLVTKINGALRVN